MRVDPQGWLVGDPSDPTIHHVPTKRTTPLIAGGARGAVWHWTADAIDEGNDLDSLALARSIVERPASGGASWHVLIDRTGAIVQSAPFTVGTWHVGEQGVIGGSNARINAAAIGVEMENAGRLLEFGGQFYAWPYWRKVDGQRVKANGADPRLVIPAHRVLHYPRTSANGFTWEPGHFDSYTVAQELSAYELVRALAMRFSWEPAAFKHGHMQFARNGKEDPGPGFLGPGGMLESILGRVFA